MEDIKVLCVHGIGGKEFKNKEKWQSDWRNAFQQMDFTKKENILYMDYDHFFIAPNAKIRLYWEFVKKTFSDKESQKDMYKGLVDDYPDMVIEFLMLDDLRKDLRKQLKKSIEIEKPHVIYAHSLGSLICYDFFTRPENFQYTDVTLVTSGSQLGNPKLENHDLKVPIETLPIKFWYNLNNRNDRMFARFPIGLPQNSQRFKEIDTSFYKSIINHDGLEYINAEKAKNEVWNIIKKEILTTKSK